MASQLELRIDAVNESVWVKHPTYDNAEKNEDVGLDIPMSSTVIVPGFSTAYTVNLGFKAEQNVGYMLIPRSSLAKTPLRLANSIGIIDKGYRGDVMAKVDNNSDRDVELEVGKCYFQIVAFNGVLPKWVLCNDVNETSRGSGAFGSTTE